VKFDGFGYYVFEGEGETPVGDLGYNLASHVVTQDIEDDAGVFEPRGRYNLRVESYYWIDNNPENGEVDEGELIFSTPEEIGLIVDRDPPQVK